MDYYEELLDLGVDPDRIERADGDYETLYNTIIEECANFDNPTGSRGCGDCGAPANSYHAGNCVV